MGSPADPARRLASEDGFALIEVLAAAVLLVVVTLASLSVFDAAAKTSGHNKARSVAAVLAEQDQERMKGMTAAELSNYHASRTASPGGTATYTINSRAEWIRDAGGAESCTTSDSQADYLRITSTVSGPIMTKPVTTATLIQPPVDSFGSDVGTLTVKVVDRDNQPVPGVTVAISGGTSLSDLTNSLGCAVFSHIPAGAYTATTTAADHVDADGNSPGTVSGTVTAGEVTVLEEAFDAAATVNATFVTYRNSWAGTAQEVPSSARSMSVAGPTETSIVKDTGSQASLGVTGLFPFTAGYTAYTGSCASANPTAYLANFYTAYPSGAVAPNPGATGNAVVRQPPLAVRVRVTNQNPTVGDANVVATPNGAGCSADKIAMKTTTDGYASKSTTSYDAGLPFGSYSVCVDATVNGTRRRGTTTYDANALTVGAAAVKSVNLVGGSTSGACS
jgi:Tfp pilus assembly protein PilV